MGFRRRRIGRFLSRARRLQRPLANKVLDELKRAHEFKEQGRHMEAAAIFEQLARKAQLRSLPQFPQLLLQAGRSHIQGGDTEKGVDQIKLALSALVETGRSERVARLQSGLQALFLEYNLGPSWLEIQAMLEKVGFDAQSPLPGSLRLPSKCPYCGASLVPEELDEISSEAAVCGYCGSYVQAGESKP